MKLFFLIIKTYLRLLYLSFFKRREIPPVQRRSLPFCLIFFLLFPPIAFFNLLCFKLDELFFPLLRRKDDLKSVFILGPPRCCKTSLHRLLATNEELFFCFRTWEIIFPSLLQKKVLTGIARLDRLTGNHLLSFIERWEERHRDKELGRMHQNGLFLPEEDEFVLIHILAGLVVSILFPYAELDKILRFDTSMDAHRQRLIMDFYIECVRRQACFRGGAVFLSQSVMFAGRVENLLTWFPDCKIIFLIRNPLDVVPSMIDMVRTANRIKFARELREDFDERMYEDIKFFYTYSLDRVSSLLPDRCIVVNYEELLRDPRLMVTTIYARLGLSLAADYLPRLDEEAEKMKRYRSRHHYSLDQCKITRTRIVSELRPVFDRFGFDTREPRANYANGGEGGLVHG